jgi:predicted nucleic acid-binding protein
MSANRPFLDSNILLYAHAGGDVRSIVARQLIEAGGTISVQVLNEFAAVASCKLRRSWKEIRSALEDLVALFPDPVPVTLQLHEAAIEIADRFGYTIYDSLIIAAALEARCDVLFSEDMRDGQKIQGLTIRNPLR